MDQQNLGSKRSASSSSGKIAAKTHEAAEQMKGAVVDQAHQVRDRALSTKGHTSDRIRGVATQLQNVGDTLREGDPLVAGLADRASQGVEGLARYVDESTPQTFVRDAERLARRQPALFYGGALLMGLALGRFLKSSGPEVGVQPGGYPEEPGGPLARNDDRSSGFFPADRAGSAGSNRRFQENYDATFGRDTDDPLRPEATRPEVEGNGRAP